jgi:peptide/nickel transport system substrate-binding protein
MEKLRAAFVREPDPVKRKQIAEQAQVLNFEEVLFVPWGQFVVPGAFRKNVQGVLQFGATLLWNISV